jgi:hypothetical protein
MRRSYNTRRRENIMRGKRTDDWKIMHKNKPFKRSRPVLVGGSLFTLEKNQLSIINHKKRKGKGRKDRGHQPEESLMNPETKALIPQ